MTDFILPSLTAPRITSSGALVAYFTSIWALKEDGLVLTYEWRWKHVRLFLDLQVHGCGESFTPTAAYLSDTPHHPYESEKYRSWFPLSELKSHSTEAGDFCEGVFLFQRIEPLEAVARGSALFQDLSDFNSTMGALTFPGLKRCKLPPAEVVRRRDYFEAEGVRSPLVESRGKDGSRFLLAKDLHRRWHYAHEHTGFTGPLPYLTSVEKNWQRVVPEVYEGVRAEYSRREELALAHLNNALKLYTGSDPAYDTMVELRDKSGWSFREWAHVFCVTSWEARASEAFLRAIVATLRPGREEAVLTPAAMEKVLGGRRPLRLPALLRRGRG